MTTVRAIKNSIRGFILRLADFFANQGPHKIIPHTLLLIRVDAIGDYILFRNFIEIIKRSEKYKDYKITLCGNIAYRNLFENLDNDFVDDVIWIDRKQMTKSFYYRFKMIRKIGKLGAEVAVQPTYSREFYCGDAILKASKAKERIGSSGDNTILSKREKNISDKYYTKLINASSKVLFEFERNREFISTLLQMPVTLKKPFVSTKNIQVNYFTPPRDFVVISPSANVDIKKWNIENYTEIADFIISQFDLDVVIVGDKENSHLGEQIRLKINKDNVLDLTGKTTLTELIKIVSSAQLVISNDSAVAHFAAITGAPVICISRGHNFGRFTRYPKEINDNFFTVYPREIMNRIQDEEFLIENFRYDSRLDVKSVKIEDVKEKIIEMFIRNNRNVLHDKTLQ